MLHAEVRGGLISNKWDVVAFSTLARSGNAEYREKTLLTQTSKTERVSIQIGGEVSRSSLRRQVVSRSHSPPFPYLHGRRIGVTAPGLKSPGPAKSCRVVEPRFQWLVESRIGRGRSYCRAVLKCSSLRFKCRSTPERQSVVHHNDGNRQNVGRESEPSKHRIETAAKTFVLFGSSEFY